MKLLKKLSLCSFSGAFALSGLSFAEGSATTAEMTSNSTTALTHRASVVIDNETSHSFVCHMQSNVTASPSSSGSISPGLMGKIVFNWQGDQQRLKSDIHCVSTENGEIASLPEITLAIKSTGCSLGLILANAVTIPIVGAANSLLGQPMPPNTISCDRFDLLGGGNGYGVDTDMRYGNFNNYLFYFKLTENP